MHLFLVLFRAYQKYNFRLLNNFPILVSREINCEQILEIIIGRLWNEACLKNWRLDALVERRRQKPLKCCFAESSQALCLHDFTFRSAIFSDVMNESKTATIAGSDILIVERILFWNQN